MVHAGITPGRVAAVGAELADDIGFERVTVAEVARRLGVRTPSLYSHVGGTADLRARVTLLALEELADRATDAVAGRSRAEALAGLADAYRDYAREHPGRFSASSAALEPSTAASSAGPRHTRLMEAVLRGYDLDPAVHVHAVRLIGSTVRGFITLEASGAFSHSGPAPQESWAHVIGALDAVLGAWPAP
ncbi:TetR/AcrR family transcriptional regulator [Sanguibacter suaedae]|uniref:WHG domain-containing protein n=1 Tax=Sanguibacter suaedae TaxID=2795737 RepID=A0A934IBT3_9MICO|nr:TetR/AcrR family transcriptional regulator [Sanguibacter suaedae]MBI9115790.1 WHG domain-containing protein [Sanguibacter suaedae]